MRAGVYPAVPEDVPLFAEDPMLCNTSDGPVQFDLRCQGFPGDRCGCLNVPQVANAPYFGCVLAGYTSQSDEVPLVTLPGVVDVGVLQSISSTCVDNSRAIESAQPCAPRR